MFVKGCAQSVSHSILWKNAWLVDLRAGVVVNHCLGGDAAACTSGSGKSHGQWLR